MTRDQYIFEEIQKCGGFDGRCWHNYQWIDDKKEPAGGHWECHCGLKTQYHASWKTNPNFTTPDGFFVLWREMRKLKEWLDFKRYLHEPLDYDGDFEQHETPDIYIDKILFRNAAYEWLGGKE
jgi:hypothetical protein